MGHEVYVERKSEMKLVQPTIMFALRVSLANRFEKDVPNSFSCFFLNLGPYLSREIFSVISYHNAPTLATFMHDE